MPVCGCRLFRDKSREQYGTQPQVWVILQHPNQTENLICGKTEAGSHSKLQSVSISSSHRPLEDTSICSFTCTFPPFYVGVEGGSVSEARPTHAALLSHTGKSSKTAPMRTCWSQPQRAEVATRLFVSTHSQHVDLRRCSTNTASPTSVHNVVPPTGPLSGDKTSQSAYLTSQHCCLLKETFSA